MGIRYYEENQLFHLQASDTSYIMQFVKGGFLAHLYWGKKLKWADPKHLISFVGRSSFSPNPDPNDGTFSLDTLPQEYPQYGTSDFRNPAYQVQQENGSTVTRLEYVDHIIIKGKPALDGLPSTYTECDDEAETLRLELEDKVCGLHLVLYYTVYEKMNVITRSVRFINGGNERLKLLRALSMSIDFADAGFDLIHLYGSWARERYVERTPLMIGSQGIQSRRGSSSHQHNPFMALVRKNSTEDYGEVYGFSLVYSGSFVSEVEVDQFLTSRVSMGINPFNFSWLLEPGQSFQTPEAVMVYSSNGLGGMSRTYHKLYRTRLCRGVHRDRPRPILINNWEATYFNFNAEKIENIAKSARDVGIELFVLDDGWFGKRNDSTSSLGDWFVDRRKLPGGLDKLAANINSMGMLFGLWFEPEMVSPDSDLYRKHPDWCLHVPNRNRTLGRNQLVLDFSRQDVCEEITGMISEILSTVPVSYVKWDMNRNMTEIGSAVLPAERQQEVTHRYMLGLYGVLERLVTKFPDILFESCSGGGGRFDPGMLYYMPQTWTSDDTDAVERLKIQYGTSLVYPPVSMGAHVSAVPNHQVNRSTSLKTRGDVAMSGNFGYELDLTRLSDEERKQIKEQTNFYKEIRNLVQLGDFFRLVSPFENNGAAWMFVSEDKAEAIVFYFETLAVPHAPLARLQLKGLDPEARYVCVGTEAQYGGDELMYAGISVPNESRDFFSHVWRFKICV